MIAARAFAAVAAALFVTTAVCADASEQAAGEAAFMRSVKVKNTAQVMTGDLVHAAGTHVAYDCDVGAIVRPGMMIAQCGYREEPVDLFVELPTHGLRVSDRVRVLGIMQRPASWTNLLGHTVYYAFLKAVFVHRLPPPKD